MKQKRFSLFLLAIVMAVSNVMATSVKISRDFKNKEAFSTAMTVTTTKGQNTNFNITVSSLTKAGFTFDGVYDALNNPIWDKNGNGVVGEYWDESNNWKKDNATLTAYTHWKDNGGISMIEFTTGRNRGGNATFALSSLNNSGGGISYSYSQSATSYTYKLNMSGDDTYCLYAYLMFNFSQNVGPFSRAKVTFSNNQFLLNTNSAIATTVALYSFDTYLAARNTQVYCQTQTTTPNPDSGTTIKYFYQNAKGEKKEAINNVLYFDNSKNSERKTIEKYFLWNLCSRSGSRTNYSTLTYQQNNGQYFNVEYDYYKHVTFIANGGTGTMHEQKIENSANLTNNAFTRDGFTFAGWNTKRDGSGKAYANGAAITATEGDNGLVTLYAQWTAQPITVKLDYTYRTSEQSGVETYEHMQEVVQQGENPFTNKVRANFRDHNGTIQKSVIFTAPAATTPGGTPTDDINTHKTAAITFNLMKGSGTDVLEGANCTVYLDTEEYINYKSVDFEVMNADASDIAHHWVSDIQDVTHYIFKYEGHQSNNMFELTWRVNLKNLSMYPSDIFVKPMRKGTHDGGEELVQIPAMQGIKGIECELAGYIDASGNNVSIDEYNNKTPEQKAEFNKNGGAYYTGEYNVLSTCAHAKPYNYEIGLTGFILDGNTYFLAETQGAIPTDMRSNAVASSTSTAITFDRLNMDIPVLILSPNGDGATVNEHTDYVLYVDNHATRTVNLAQFEAVRPNYDFVGWKDPYDQTEYEKDGDYHFEMGTKATTTLQAQWKRSTAPQVEFEAEEEEDNNLVYYVKVTDDLKDIQSVKYIYTNGNTEPAADAAEWDNMINQGDNIYTHSISLLNDNNGKYLWVKADNTDKHSIVNLGVIRSIYKLTANPNPDSRVVEQDVTSYDYYSTFFYSDRTFTADDIEVYTASVEGDQLKMNKVTTTQEGHVVIPAETAVILRKDHATDGIIELQEYDGDVSSIEGTNALEGVDDVTSQEINYDYYVLSYGQEGLGFYINSSAKLAAHKAYIKLSNSSARAFTLNFSDDDTPSDATGIKEIETVVDTDAIFDLSGRKVNNGNVRSGIYIKGGKKIMIK